LQKFNPLGLLVTFKTASAWVWSTNLKGKNACKNVATDGLGD